MKSSVIGADSGVTACSDSGGRSLQLSGGSDRGRSGSSADRLIGGGLVVDPPGRAAGIAFAAHAEPVGARLEVTCAGSANSGVGSRGRSGNRLGRALLGRLNIRATSRAASIALAAAAKAIRAGLEVASSKKVCCK